MNLTFVEGRSIQPFEVCHVYYNIHKGGFSIRSNDKRNPHNGKVVAHAPSVVLSDCEFKVSQVSVKKIRQNKRKAVCAYIKGTFVGIEGNHNGMEEIYFNPYNTKQFISVDTNVPVLAASTVYCSDKKCWGRIIHYMIRRNYKC